MCLVYALPGTQRRFQKTEARAQRERDNIAAQEAKLRIGAASMWPGLEVGKTCEDCDGEFCKYGRDPCKLQKKKEALEDKKPTWQDVSQPAARLIRFPFISPEDLNKIKRDKTFLSIEVLDLVLDAVFHQVIWEGGVREGDQKFALKDYVDCSTL